MKESTQNVIKTTNTSDVILILNLKLSDNSQLSIEVRERDHSEDLMNQIT